MGNNVYTGNKGSIDVNKVTDGLQEKGINVQGNVHSHPNQASFSSADIGGLMSFRDRNNDFQEGQTMIVETKYTRYALVVENKEKAKKFFLDYYHIDGSKTGKVKEKYDAETKGRSADWINATEDAVRKAIGNSSVSGIGFYKSKGDKSNFEKIN